MSRTKKALMKYLSVSESKFILITLDDERRITLSLKQERFKHLIGLNHINKWKKIPAKECNSLILDKDILNDKYVDSLDKNTKDLIKKKSKTILGDMNFKDAEYVLSPKELITIGKNVVGNLFSLNYNKTKTKIFIIVFKKDQFDIYHPSSAMQVKLNDMKIKQLDKFVKTKCEKIEHSFTSMTNKKPSKKKNKKKIQKKVPKK